MPTQTFSINIEHDQAVIALTGEHETYTADKLAKQITALIAEGVGVTVDLQQAAFIDSTVVGVLIAADRRASEGGLSFSLVVGNETGWPVRRLLEVTGLGERLDIHD